MFDRVEDRLKELAKGSDTRSKLLEARKKREKVRSRYLSCTACDGEEYSTRDAVDICPACLRDLWSARDVVERAHSDATTNGLIPVVLPDRPHDQPYPHLATTHEKVPDVAFFARERSGGRGEAANSDRTMQLLLHEIVVGLSTAYPSDPEGRKNAVSLFTMQKAGHSFYGEVHARIPEQAATALCHMWHLFRWHSHEAFRQGFAAGHDLLGRMNLGDATHEQFLSDIAAQTKRTRAALQKAEEGRIDR